MKLVQTNIVLPESISKLYDNIAVSRGMSRSAVMRYMLINGQLPPDPIVCSTWIETAAKTSAQPVITASPVTPAQLPAGKVGPLDPEWEAATASSYKTPEPQPEPGLAALIEEWDS